MINWFGACTVDVIAQETRSVYMYSRSNQSFYKHIFKCLPTAVDLLLVNRQSIRELYSHFQNRMVIFDCLPRQSTILSFLTARCMNEQLRRVLYNVHTLYVSCRVWWSDFPWCSSFSNNWLNLGTAVKNLGLTIFFLLFFNPFWDL